MSEEITKKVKEFALELGADKVGIADATLASCSILVRTSSIVSTADAASWVFKMASIINFIDSVMSPV